MIPSDTKKAHEKRDGSESSTSTVGNRTKRQWDKPVIVKRGATGHVKWFNFEKGFGFINVDGGSNRDESVFVHASAIVSILPSIKCYLADGEKVEFDIMQGVKGKEAIAVTGQGGMKAGQRRVKSRHSNSPRRRGGRSRSKQRTTHTEPDTLAEDIAAKLTIRRAEGSGGKKTRQEGRTAAGKRDDADSDLDDYDEKKASSRQGVLVRKDRRYGGK